MARPALAPHDTFQWLQPHSRCLVGRQAFNGVIINQARRASVHLAGERAARVSVINLNVLAPPPEEPPKPTSHRQTRSAPEHITYMLQSSHSEELRRRLQYICKLTRSTFCVCPHAE